MYNNIFEAIRHNDTAAVNQFLISGYDLLAVDPAFGLTPSNFAARLGFDALCELLLQHEAILKSRSNILPASHSQQRFYFLNEMLADPSAYYEHSVLEFTGEFDSKLFSKALSHLIQRHESLRTQFILDKTGELQQQILPSLDINSVLTEEKYHADFNLEGFLTAQHDFLRDHFLLNNAPLWRVKLLRQSSNTVFAFFVFHHIVIDAYSVSLLFKELFSLYRAIKTLPKALQMREYSQWESEWHKTSDYQLRLDYWQQRLGGYESQIAISSDISTDDHSVTLKENGRSLVFEMDSHYHRNLIAFSKKAKATPFTVYLAAYFVLLSRYTQQNDIIVGTPFMNRLLKNSETAVGCFINTLPVRCQFNADQSFVEVLKSLSRNLQEDLLNGQVPYNAMVKKIALERENSAANLIQTFFTYQLGIDLNLDLSEYHLPFTAESKNIEHNPPGTTHYPISMELIQKQGENYLVFNFRSDLYSEAFIERMFMHYCNILKLVIENPQTTIQDIDILNDSERHQQLIEWTQVYRDYPKTTLVQLFEEQVKKTPEAIAIVFEDQSISYHELNSRSNQVAHCLRQQGIGLQPDMLVGIGLERSVEMMIGMLAILKAGGAYVPMDPSHPDNRLGDILEDTQIRVLLTQEYLLPRWESIVPAIEGVSVISLNSFDYMTYSNENLLSNVKPEHLAYIIYTSGSTGKPKGVMLEHRNVINYLFNIHQKFSTFERIDFSSNLTFDLSVTTTLYPLCFGKTVFPFKGSLLEGDQFIQHLIHHDIELVKSTPALMNTLASHFNHNYRLKACILGGEKLDKNSIRSILTYCDRIIDEYGPTETTVGTTYYEITANTREYNIGKCYDNYHVYVLDAHGKIAPVGVIGELYIAGAGVARGYLHRAELTAERFVFLKLTESSAAIRLYRTGDLVRYLPDGNLDYIGRADHQIKIRGFRVELGEIEAQLLKHKSISNAVVVVHENANNKQLVGYFVAESIMAENIQVQETFIQEVRQQLAQFLPEYMIPAHMILLEKMPLNSHGKVDRKALPKPQLILEDKQVKPRDLLEQQMSDVWQEVLGLKDISIEYDFFKIGGDSILSIQLASRLRKQGIECTVKQIFEHRTIRRLTDFLRNNTATIRVRAEQGILQGKFELLPIQKHFFTSKLKRQNHWNQSFLIRVPLLDKTKLQALLLPLINQHDALRLCFAENVQFYRASIELPKIKQLNCSGLSEKEIQQQLTAWQSHFDIEHGPLWQIGYIEGYSDGSARIYMALHHLIVDTVSWRILVEDIQALYMGGQLRVKTSSYRQWVATVEQYALEHPAELNYWQTVVADQQSPYSGMIHKKANTYAFELNSTLTESLIRKSARAYHTEINDLLLTALSYALMEWTGTAVNHISLEGHGREQINEAIDVSRTVGWFTTLFPVRLVVQETLPETIKSIKENLRHIPCHGLGYGALKHNLLPKISFNYLGQFDSVDNDLWQIDFSQSGHAIHPDNQDANILTINGFVTKGKLCFQIISYCEDKYNLRFVAAFENQLQSVIEHCSLQIELQREVYTPSDFPHVNIEEKLLDRLQNQYAIQAIYPANSLQQGFIYHAITQPHDDAYRVQMLLDYHAELDVVCYHQAWQAAVATYPILRTCFNWEGDLIQIVVKNGDVVWQEHDISDAIDKEAALNAIQQADRDVSFDLTQPRLLRIHLVKHDAAHYTVIKSEHHTIGDGWSNAILFKKVHEYYALLSQGHSPVIQEETTYLAAQHYYLTHKNEAQYYWQHHLSSTETSNDLSVFFSQKTDINAIRKILEPCEIACLLEAETYAALQKLIRGEGLTLNVLVQFAWHKLIQVYTRDVQTIVGTTVSGRDLSLTGIEESVGLFINTLPLVMNWSEDNTVLEQLHLLHRNLSNLNSHSYAELAKLQHSGQRLFHSLLVFENYPIPQSRPLSVTFRGAIEKLDYPLGLVVYEDLQGLHLKLNYAGEYMQSSQALKILHQLQIILNEIPQKLLKSHHDISLIDAIEYQLQVDQWNHNSLAYPTSTLHQLFEQQVIKTPESIAVVYENKSLTYAELNARANQVAHYLYSQGFGTQPDMLIGLGTERSLEMLVGILAILKAGAAYVPLDIALPDERLTHMLMDAQLTYVLTQKHLVSRWLSLKNKGKNFLTIPLDTNIFLTYSSDNLGLMVQSSNLAYVIYTSGTTGKPKGVMLPHDGVVNLIFNQRELLSLGQNKSVLQFSSISFDAAVWEIFSSLTFGLKIYIANNDERHDINKLLTILKDKRINIITLPPVVLSQAEPAELPDLKVIVVAGESCHENVMKAWSKNRTFINAYGPTEITVCASTHLYKESSLATCIGRSLKNIQLYILNEHKQVVPIGVAGELYVGGAGLARGYLNRDDLTQEKFIRHHFDKDSTPVRLYKTGDLVRYLTDGQIEYIGRVDNQIKIRGFRVELEEIESHLIKQAQIINAAVLLKETAGDKKLIAYLVSSQASAENIAVKKAFIQSLRSNLATFLPEYMIPTHMVLIEKMPINVNGKIDRKALQALAFEISSDNDFIAPVTEIEKKLALLWSQILQIPLEKVGLHDNFFDCGGHSILAMKFVLQARQQFFIEIEIGQFYQSPTLATVIKIIQGAETGIDACFLPLAVDASKPILFLMPPLFSVAMVYKKLLPSLAQEFSVYGINYPNFMSGELRYFDSLEDLSHEFLQKIRQLQPRGPYHLGGWSLGGNIALTMTYQLQAMSEEVKTILLLDTTYKAYRDEQGLIYMTLFVETLLSRLNVTQDMGEEILQRLVLIATHLESLMLKHKPKCISSIDRLCLIKCQGALVDLAAQRNTNLDWRGTDMLNGIRYYLSQGQQVHVHDIACHHVEVFYDRHIKTLNQLITKLLHESKEDAYVIGQEMHQIEVAARKNALYLQEGFLMEMSDFDTKVQLNDASDIEEQSSENFSEQFQQMLIEMMQRHKTHALDSERLVQILPHNQKFLTQVLQLLFEASQRYAAKLILQLTQKLLVLRLASKHSTALMDAYMLDGIFLALTLQIAQDLTLPMANYVSVAITRHEDFRIGETFDAAIWISLTMALPMALYAIFSGQISSAIGLNTDYTDVWHTLALYHMIAIFPALINQNIEKFYYTLYRYHLPTLGTACEVLITLSTILGCSYLNNLTAANLGLALSFGSLSRLTCYMLDLYFNNYFTQYQLFKNLSFPYIKRYLQESYIYTATSLAPLSYLILACLLSSEESTQSLTAFLVAKNCIDIVLLVATIVTAASGIVSTQFSSGAVFHYAAASEVISVEVSLISAVLLAIPLIALNGQEVTEFFIDIQTLSVTDDTTFFDDVKQAAYFFIILGIMSAIRTPFIGYLYQKYAHTELCVISIVCDIALTFSVIAILYATGDDSMLNLLAGFFAVNSVATLLTIYYWMRVSDFYLHPMQEKSANAESSCAKWITTFSAIFHSPKPHDEEVPLLSEERRSELLDNSYNTF